MELLFIIMITVGQKLTYDWFESSEILYTAINKTFLSIIHYKLFVQLCSVKGSFDKPFLSNQDLRALLRGHANHGNLVEVGIEPAQRPSVI